MLKRILLLIFSCTLLAQPHPSASPDHLFPSRNGLALLYLAQDGFALAADGAQRNADGTLSQAQRIFQLGKTGAVVFAGKSSVQDPVGRKVREEFNPERITAVWLESHPDASIEQSTEQLGNLITTAANHYFPSRMSPRDAGQYRFAVVFVGYSDGKPFFRGTRYFLPSTAGKPMRAQTVPAALQLGELWGFGLLKAEQELRSGHGPYLKTYKEEPPVKTFRSADRASVSATDAVHYFRSVLEATESAEGKKLDPAPGLIGSPNRFATITQENGFSWNH